MTMETYISETRSWRLPIPFLDFLVDGESPIEGVLGKGSDRLPTRLQPEWEHFSLDEQIDRLLGLGAPEYEDGRTAMYICRCGDLDCFGIGRTHQARGRDHHVERLGLERWLQAD